MEELLNSFLRYGMFLGAIFQLVCIAAVIILPEQIKPNRVSLRIVSALKSRRVYFSN